MTRLAPIPTVRGLAALYTGTFLSGAWAIIIPTIPVLAREFGVSAGGAAQVVTVSISGIIVIAMIIPAGFIMDRVGRKWCTVPSTGIPVFVLIPLTSSFMQLALLVAVAGLAQGLSLGSVATSTYDVVPAHVRGRLQAVRRTVAELGSGLAPLFGGYLANTFNPGVPFLFYAPLLAVSVTLLAVVGKETLER